MKKLIGKKYKNTQTSIRKEGIIDKLELTVLSNLNPRDKKKEISLLLVLQFYTNKEMKLFFYSFNSMSIHQLQ